MAKVSQFQNLVPKINFIQFAGDAGWCVKINSFSFSSKSTFLLIEHPQQLNSLHLLFAISLDNPKIRLLVVVISNTTTAESIIYNGSIKI